MTTKVITRLDQVTTRWLTDVLTASGALNRGAVTSFEVVAGSGNWSTNARLALRYEAQALGDRPAALFLKLVDTDTGDGEYFLPAEVTYYSEDYVDVPQAPLIRCYDARYSAAAGRYHILLDDVTATHVTADQKPVSLVYGRELVEGLAALHARWWGAGRLAKRGAVIHDARQIHRFIDIGLPGAQVVVDNLRPRLKDSWPAAIAQIAESLGDALVARTADDNGFTLIHGDVNSRNIMVPRDGDRPVYIIDCQPFDWSLTAWLAAYDLAYAITLDWEADARREMEPAILRHYYECLGKQGIRSYTWEQFYDDYRLSVALCVVVALEYFRGGVNWEWIDFRLGLVQKTLTAFDDHRCEALLG